jgi:hypothetical protein
MDFGDEFACGDCGRGYASGGVLRTTVENREVSLYIEKRLQCRADPAAFVREDIAGHFDMFYDCQFHFGSDLSWESFTRRFLRFNV